jgi:hypothetical protein
MDVQAYVQMKGRKEEALAPNFIRLSIKTRNKNCGWSNSNIQTKVVL